MRKEKMEKTKHLNKKEEQIRTKTYRYLLKQNTPDIDQKMALIDQLLHFEKRERYSYLYDLICDYFDQEFKEKNICAFSCGICKRRQSMIDQGTIKDTYQNGCCYSYRKKELCKHYVEGKGCAIKNIACKVYTCHYLRKRGYHYHVRDLYFARYFFNKKQFFYMENTFFQDKTIVLNGILERE